MCRASLFTVRAAAMSAVRRTVRPGTARAAIGSLPGEPMTSSRDSQRVIRHLLAAVVGVALSGCSFVSVQRARPPAKVEDPRAPEECTTSKRAPIVDTVIAAAGFTAAVVATAAFAEENPDGQGYWIVGLPFYAVGGLSAGSAAYGYTTTAQCRRRIALGARCANGDLEACLRRKPGWEPPPGWRAGPTLEPRSPPGAPAPGAPPWTSEPPQPGSTPAER